MNRYTVFLGTTYDDSPAFATWTIVPQDRCTDVRAVLETLRDRVEYGLVACLPGTILADAVRFVRRKSRIGFLSRESLDTLTPGGR